MNRKSGAQRIGEVLAGFLEREGLASRLKHLEIYSAWEEVAGPGTLPHTRVAGFAHHKLYVDVDSASHLHELRSFRKQQLLKELRDKVPGVLVREIIFRPAPLHRS